MNHRIFFLEDSVLPWTSESSAPYRAVETVLVQSALTSVERLHEMFRVY